MNLKTKKKFKYNILFIVIYFVFLFSFPFLRNYFNVNKIQVAAPETVLIAADSSTNFVSNIFYNILGYFSNRKNLLDEISRLENELQIEKDKNVINVNGVGDAKKIVAKKIFSDFTNIYETILLNKGREAGVEEEAIVFLYPDKAIGVVSSVGEKSSLVSLYSKDKNQVEGVVRARNFRESTETIPIQNENILEGENFDSSNSTSGISSASTSTSTSLNEININLSTPISSADGLLIEFIGYGGGDFIAKIPENIKISTGTIIYLARDESKALGEIIKIEKQEAAFYQVLFVRGYYNTRENGNYYIENN